MALAAIDSLTSEQIKAGIEKFDEDIEAVALGIAYRVPGILGTVNIDCPVRRLPLCHDNTEY